MQGKEIQEGSDKNLKCGVVSASINCKSDDINVTYNDGMVETQGDFAHFLTPGVYFHVCTCMCTQHVLISV